MKQDVKKIIDKHDDFIIKNLLLSLAQSDKYLHKENKKELL